MAQITSPVEWFLQSSSPTKVIHLFPKKKNRKFISICVCKESLCTKIEENLIKQKLDEDEGSHGYLNLLVVNCFNTLLTLFNTDQIVKSDSSCPGLREFRVQKSAYLKSIKHDYRLINLYCLFKQAELNIERLSASSSHLIAHLADSLNSLRASLRAFVDESFES